jgi:iron complex transport system substrate-binding protein
MTGDASETEIIWNSVTDDESNIFSINITMDEGKEVEFGISSDSTYEWVWLVNGENIKESEGEYSNLSYVFEEYGFYNVSAVGRRDNETECWDVTVFLAIGKENDIRELGGLEDYTLLFSERPERIVSMAPSCTEILFAVGAGEYVVGVTQFCNYPPEVEEKKESGEIEVIGGYSTPSLEKIVHLEPDLIVGASGNPDDVIYRLVELGYPVYGQDPKSIDDVLDSIRLTGTITKEEENAYALVEYMEGKIDGIKMKTGDLSETQKLRVLHLCWYDPMWTAGPGTFIDEIIRKAGGINVARDKDYYIISMEKVVKENPEVVICSGMGDASQVIYDWILVNPALQQTDAARYNRVYPMVYPIIDSKIIELAGPRLVDGLEEVYELLGIKIVKDDEEIDILTERTTRICSEDDDDIILDVVTSSDISTSINIEKFDEVPAGFGPSLGKYIGIESDELSDAMEWGIIRIYYTEDELDDSNLQEDSLAIRYYDEDEWKTIDSELSTTDVVAYTGNVWANIPNIGLYGITGSERVSGGGGDGSTTSTPSEGISSELPPLSIGIEDGEVVIGVPEEQIITVVDDSPIENATVTIGGMSRLTDANGSVIIEINATEDDIPCINVTATKEGYLSVTDTISVKSLVRYESKFEITKLVIVPKKVKRGEEVRIMVDIQNIGEIDGKTTVYLKITGKIVDSKDVILASGEKKTVEFIRTEDEKGSYSVVLDGQTGEYEVTPGFPALYAIIGMLMMAHFVLRRR